MSVVDIVDLVNSGGVVGLLTLGIVAFWRGWIVRGSDLQAQRRETRFWQRTAWVALGLAQERMPTFEFDREGEA